MEREETYKVVICLLYRRFYEPDDPSCLDPLDRTGGLY